MMILPHKLCFPQLSQGHKAPNRTYQVFNIGILQLFFFFFSKKNQTLIGFDVHRFRDSFSSNGSRYASKETTPLEGLNNTIASINISQKGHYNIYTFLFVTLYIQYYQTILNLYKILHSQFSHYSNSAQAKICNHQSIIMSLL